MTSIFKRVTDFYYRFRPLPDSYGKEFKQIYAFLLESRTWDKDRIQEYKFDRLKALLKHSEQNVPYYRELFREHGIKSSDIKDFSDYTNIPILTKQILRENLSKLKADNFEAYNPLRTETSGTTGKATLLYRSRYHENFRRAVVWRFFNEFGFNFRDCRCNISYPISPDENSPVFEYDKLQNIYSINICHIMQHRYKLVYSAIKKIRPKMIWAHPGIFYMLAQAIIENNWEPLPVPLIGTYGEIIYPQVRNIITQAFPGKFFEYYANRENTVASWGNSNENFFEISEYCHLEIDNSIVVADNPEAGDIISTSLHNYAFPLIRYNSGDIGCYHGYTDPEIPYPEIKLMGGRDKNFLLTREGLYTPYFLSHLEHNKFEKIKSYQLIQLNLDEVKLRIIPREQYDQEIDSPNLIKLLEEAFSNKFKIILELVDEINFTKAGKVPAISSKLADDYLDNINL